MAELKKIAFIGPGIMGAPIAGNLMKAGFELHVWARRREKAEPLLSAGAGLVWEDGPGDHDLMYWDAHLESAFRFLAGRG